MTETDSKLGERLVEALTINGVDTVFGIGGTHTLPLLGALERLGTMRYIPARTELGAAYMAIGYGRCQRRPAALLTSTGPGALNASSALQDAVWSSIPLLHVTTYSDGPEFSGAVHETPRQAQLLGAASKCGIRFSGDSVAEVGAAVRAAVTPPNGPVTIEFPALGWDAEPPPPDPELPTASVEPGESADPGELDALRTALEESKRPLLFVGGGVVRAGAEDLLRRLAEHLGAPVVTGTQGRTAMSSEHPLYVGPLGGEAAVDELVAAADMVLVLGSKLTLPSTGRYTMPLPAATYRLDAAPRPHGKFRFAMDVRGSLAVDLGRLRVGSPRSPWAEGRPADIRAEVIAAAHERSPAEADLVADIAAAGPADVTGDMNKGSFWLAKYLAADPSMVFAMSGYMAMGTALPMAIGVAAASGEPALAFLGDGGLQMSLSELATLAESGLPVTIVVMVDGLYGLLRDNGRRSNGSEHLGVDLWNPDWKAVASANRMPFVELMSPAGLREELDRVVDGPRMIAINHATDRTW